MRSITFVRGARSSRPRVERARAFAGLWLGVALVAGGCSKHGPGGGKGAAAFKMPPMPAETAMVKQGRVIDRFDAVGTIEAVDAITVASEIDGLVTSLPFREGEAIRKGGVLAQLDDSQLRAEMARAEALRDQAQATYDRTKTVVEQAAGAQQDLDDTAAALKVADANVQLAKARLAKTRIVATVERHCGGAPGQPWSLRARRRDDHRSHRSARDQGAVHGTGTLPGDAASRRCGDGVDAGLSGPKARRPHRARRAGARCGLRSARIQARVPNSSNQLRPGMSANITAVLSEREAALSIPAEAVFVEGNQSLVYAVQTDSTVQRVVVALGTRTATDVEVVDGLKAGSASSSPDIRSCFRAPR
jgi:membrane fusion protein (multidrug efflux system)